MAAAAYVQTSFLGGEWSKTMQGRSDREDYRTGMNFNRNGLILDTGAWTRRPGSRTIAPTRNGAPGRVIAFPFQQAHPYNLELTDGTLRATNGATLVTTNDDVAIADVSSANPAVVTTQTVHGWSTGQQVQLNLSGALCPSLQRRQFLITVLDATHFSLADPITLVPINGSILNWVAPATLPTVSRIFELPVPYSISQVASLRMVQAQLGGVVNAVTLQQGVPPQILSAIPAAGLQKFASFTINPANFVDGPYLDPVAGGATVTPSALTGNVTLTIAFTPYLATTSYAKGAFVSNGGVNYQSLLDANLNNTPASSPVAWSVVNSGIAVGPTGFVSTDIGRMIRLFSEPPLWDIGTAYTAGAVVAYNNGYWTLIKASSTGDQPGILATTWAPNAAGGLWTWGKIIAVASQISSATGVFNEDAPYSNGANAFDGIVVQPYVNCAQNNSAPGGGARVVTMALGKDFHLSGAQTIGSVLVYPPSNAPFIQANFGQNAAVPTMTVELRASHTQPFNFFTDGVSLGTTTGILQSASIASVQSTDTTTAWEFVWVAISGLFDFFGVDFGRLAIAEIQMYNGGAASGTNSVTFQILGNNLLYTTPIRVWRMGLYSNTTSWPTVGTYHEGRLYLGGVIPNRVDAAVANGFVGSTINFAPTAPNGSVPDSSGFSYIFNSDTLNPAYWMISDERGVILGTQSGEWLIFSSANNNIITPTTVQAHPVTHIGCANIEPKRTGLTYAFVQRYTRKLQEYFADVYSGKFASPNLSEKAKHLTKSGIAEIAYQNELTPTIWARTNAGDLIGAAYKRESLLSSQGPSFVAWHKHFLGSGRKIESLCVGPSVDGSLDTLAMITNDTATGIRHLEYLGDVFEEGDDLITDADFLDSSAAPTSYTFDTTGITFNGFWYLNGKTVSVFAGGLDCGDVTITNGSCFVAWKSDPDRMFTAEYYLSGGQLTTWIGFNYQSFGQILRPMAPQQTGVQQGPGLGQTRRTDQFGILTESTRMLDIGTKFDSMYPCLFRKENSTALLGPLELAGGINWDSLKDTYSFDSLVCWRTNRMFPATIMAIGGFPNTQNR